MAQHNYDTLSEAIEGLKAEGYTEDFNLKRSCIECTTLNLELSPDESEIDQQLRFEGMSNPDDSSILYAISSTNNRVKGLLVDAYGVYADSLTQEMVEKLRYRP